MHPTGLIFTLALLVIGMEIAAASNRFYIIMVRSQKGKNRNIVRSYLLYLHFVGCLAMNGQAVTGNTQQPGKWVTTMSLQLFKRYLYISCCICLTMINTTGEVHDTSCGGRVGNGGGCTLILCVDVLRNVASRLVDQSEQFRKHDLHST